MHNFCDKMPDYSKIIHCLQEKATNFGLEVSVVYVVTSIYVLIWFKYFLRYISR